MRIDDLATELAAQDTELTNIREELAGTKGEITAVKTELGAMRLLAAVAELARPLLFEIATKIGVTVDDIYHASHSVPVPNAFKVQREWAMRIRREMGAAAQALDIGDTKTVLTLARICEGRSVAFHRDQLDALGILRSLRLEELPKDGPLADLTDELRLKIIAIYDAEEM